MKKVYLLGDSIMHIGYGTILPSVLGEAYEVHRPDVNCRFAKFTYRSLYDWQEDMAGTDIVHWNNGLWDAICNRPDPMPVSSPEEYCETMVRIARYLLSKYKVVVFATTTPVRVTHPDLTTERIREYNAMVVPKLKELGVLINDLHAVVATDIDRYIREDDNIHLTEDGIAVCAEQVAKAIREASLLL
jgi:hypothetical protein